MQGVQTENADAMDVDSLDLSLGTLFMATAAIQVAPPQPEPLAQPIAPVVTATAADQAPPLRLVPTEMYASYLLRRPPQ